MKVFIGTMYCGETEFASCVEAINSQKDVIVDCHIVKDKPEAEAHNELWTAWRAANATGEYDFFTKVDADTILAHEYVLKTIGDLFLSNSRITGIQCPLYDYMTHDLINGLNSFSPGVIFRDTTDELYCDRVDTNHDIVLRKKDLPQNLIPAGHHATKSNDMQAFHYGLHRYLKNQIDVIDKVKKAWQGDRPRSFALLGFEAAKTWNKKSGFNYSDKEFQDAFENAKSLYESWPK